MTDALRDAWLSGRADRLGARGEALAWALRKAWYAQGTESTDLRLTPFTARKLLACRESSRQHSKLDLFSRKLVSGYWYLRPLISGGLFRAARESPGRFRSRLSQTGPKPTRTFDFDKGRCSMDKGPLKF